MSKTNPKPNRVFHSVDEIVEAFFDKSLGEEHPMLIKAFETILKMELEGRPKTTAEGKLLGKIIPTNGVKIEIVEQREEDKTIISWRVHFGDILNIDTNTPETGLEILKKWKILPGKYE